MCAAKKTSIEPSATPRSGVSAAAFVVRSGKQTSRWRERQYAMAAIGTIYKGGSPPANVSIAELTRQVNGILLRDPDYCLSGLGRKQEGPGRGEVDHMTVDYALRAYRAANA